MQVRRHGTVAVDHPDKKDVQVHVSLFVVEFDAPPEKGEPPVQTALEIREYSVSGESYGHGVLIPDTIAPEVFGAIRHVLGQGL